MPFVNRQGQRMALPIYYPNFDICSYVSNILTVGSEPVISFFNKGELFLVSLPYSFFIVYVMNKY